MFYLDYCGVMDGNKDGMFVCGVIRLAIYVLDLSWNSSIVVVANYDVILLLR